MPNGTLMQVAFHFGKTKVREMAADMRAFLRTSSHKVCKPARSVAMTLP
jgi:hypothetical protein